MTGRDENLLPGPRFPMWGCSRCGHSANWASRIKCKCGAAAPTRIIQAAKRGAAAFKLQPAFTGGAWTRGKWAQGPPKRDDELSKLRAENAKLREEAKKDGGEAELVEVEDEEQRIDLQKAQAAYTATVAAFGPDSKQAKELGADVEKLRTDKQQSKSLSAQVRAAERKVRDKQKQLNAAKLAATAAAEAVREAQRKLEAADEKVVQSMAKVQDAEKDLEALSSRPRKQRRIQHQAITTRYYWHWARHSTKMAKSHERSNYSEQEWPQGPKKNWKNELGQSAQLHQSGTRWRWTNLSGKPRQQRELANKLNNESDQQKSLDGSGA